MNPQMRVLLTAAVLVVGFSFQSLAQQITKICVDGANSSNGGNSCTPVTAANPFPVNATVTATATITGFTPTAGATAALSVTGTSADVALPAGSDIVVTSPSTNIAPVFIRMQAGAGTAVTTDMPIVPGSAIGFHILTATHISGITSGAAATLNIQGGVGLATGYGGGSNSLSTTQVSTSALAANLVINAGAANLYSFEVSADSTLSGAAWWVMIYNATTAPADGAVTPAKCYAMPSGTTNFSAGWSSAAPRFSTGVVIGVSTTGCFTKTASTHAFITGDFN